MQKFLPAILIAIVISGMTGAQSSIAQPIAQPIARLKSQSATAEAKKVPFAAIEDTSGGTLGASIIHLESGESWQYKSAEIFPTASVVKLVEAIAFLQRVDAGQYKLQDKLHLTKKDVFPVAHSPLLRNFPAKGLDVSYDDLLKQSICRSDTTADAILLAKAGGPAAVQAVMDAAGCPGIKVKETECQLIVDYAGVKDKVTDWWDKDKITKLEAAVSRADKSKAAREFERDPKNTMTPQAITDLLIKLFNGKILKAGTTAHLIAVMEKTVTGPDRIKGKLPSGTIVAHKTGTWDTTDGINAATNDCGIVTLPNNAGHICLAIFVKGSKKAEKDRALAMATLAKSAYDHWSAKQSKGSHP
jgi:beta-lactamase class A